MAGDVCKDHSLSDGYTGTGIGVPGGISCSIARGIQPLDGVVIVAKLCLMAIPGIMPAPNMYLF